LIQSKDKEKNKLVILFEVFIGAVTLSVSVSLFQLVVSLG